jgi:hypothetical protein
MGKSPKIKNEKNKHSLMPIGSHTDNIADGCSDAAINCEIEGFRMRSRIKKALTL